MSDTPRSEKNPSPQDAFVTTYYSILYVDVLNQREKLMEIKDLPETKEEHAKFLELLRNTYGVVDTLVRLFDSMTTNMVVFDDIPELSEEVKRRLNRMVGNPIDRTLFSDSLLYYISLQEDQGAVPVVRILELIYAATSVMAGALSMGIACRGGLDIGIAAKFARVGIYGPALYKAYRLENDIAQYPRIVVGPDLVGYLNSSLEDLNPTGEASVRRSFAKFCLELIYEDTDGAFALDYAHKSIQERHPALKRHLQKAFTFAVEEWNRFSKEGNHKLASRYFLVVNYLDTRLHAPETSDEDPGSKQ